MGKFATLLAKPSKTNNAPAAHAAKVQIRRNVLAEMGPESARIFDAFAGDGAMWRSVWKEGAAYVGCDLKWYRDERLAYVADNRRVMRAIDLSAFNCYDLDSYGSPWTQVAILVARRLVKPGEVLGLVLTEGSGLKLKFGGYPDALRHFANLKGVPADGALGRHELVDRAIRGVCRRMGVKVVKRWDANGKTGAAVAYIGLVLQGVDHAASEG